MAEERRPKKTVAWRAHWPEYLIEAVGLGLFMISAGAFALLLFHPESPAVPAIPSEFARRALMGCAMGVTAVALIYSPWGQRSGAHYNPAVTLTFLRLGKVTPRDAVSYAIAQFIGGIIGLQLLILLAGDALAHPAIDYVATVPGPAGWFAALLAEIGISFSLMSVVLAVSSRPALARWTGLCAGVCVALFITFEAPISGMSLNPARTLASALPPGHWEMLWIYIVGPTTGMLLAAALHTIRRPHPACAKLHHTRRYRCLFCETAGAGDPPPIHDPLGRAGSPRRAALRCLRPRVREGRSGSSRRLEIRVGVRPGSA